MTRSLLLLSALFLSGAIDHQLLAADDQPLLEEPPWPEWVHRHWVWENSGTSASAMQLVDDYITRDIPVGAVIIDRPWETDSNTLIPDPKLYPNLGELVDGFHKKDVRVFLWIASVINETASNFAEAKKNGYFLNGGKTVKWWGGRGAFVDYSNPEAVEWWHGQMDPILDLGIDGWKVDGADPFIVFLGVPQGKGGVISWPDYAAASYRDFFEYTRQRLGNDRVISARPCDDGGQFPVPLAFAPRDVNFAGWVGDQDGSFPGMQAALKNMKASSGLGYVSFGSDIGGFRDRGERTREVLIRWAQMSALCPVMENGGGGEHRPWTYDAETESIYRTFVRLHHELIPYIYCQGAKAWQNGISLLQFTDDHSFMLGDHLFVAAMVEPGTKRDVPFPPGRWRNWLDESDVHEGDRTELLEFALEQFPVYVREGAIVPLDVRDNSTAHGGDFSRDHLTLAVYPPEAGSESFDVVREDAPTFRASYESSAGTLTLRTTATSRALLWRVQGWGNAQSVAARDGNAITKVASPAELRAQDNAWTVEGDTLWIRVAKPGNGVELNASR